MADLIKDGKRGGKELAQESAKTDGECKGGETGLGGAPSMDKFHMSRGAEYAQESAKTDGMCK